MERNEKRYGLIGEKLGHSFSPLLHSKFAGYEYGLYEVPKNEIDDFFEKADFTAANVTIPYKEKAMEYCRPDERAKSIGCVNTLVSTPSGLMGYNTDTYGFEYMAVRAGIDFTDAHVAILGSGGTCRTAAYTAARLGAASLTVVSRHPSDLGLRISCPVNYVSYEDDPRDCDILINTTPVGMYPEIGKTPVDISNSYVNHKDCARGSYVNLKAVIDVIYNPLRTGLINVARKRGIKATGGLPMLVAQGFFASKLFLGGELGDDPVGELSKSDKEKLEDAITSLEEENGSIVLTGMPGSGKSTVGRIIAEKLGLEFADTDEIFTEENGMSPAECIRRDGEKAFRALEKKAVFSAARTGGKVIATGGGVIIDPENISMLELNGTIVYIHRDLEKLSTGGRPLSEGRENLKALYWKRLPIYLKSCDMMIGVKGGAESVADDIIYGLHNTEYNNCTNIIKKGKSMNILVINGSNLNMLGIREPDIYGHETYEDLMRMCRQKAEGLGARVDFYQSNHEGDLVDIIQKAYGVYDGIVINPGAYTHTSVALLDALKTVGIPTVEVHISDVSEREDFRQISYIRQYAAKTIMGHGLSGYTEAMEMLAEIVGGGKG